MKKNISLKYQRFTPSGGKNKGIRKSEFVTKTQFLCQDLSRRSIETGFLGDLRRGKNGT